MVLIIYLKIPHFATLTFVIPDAFFDMMLRSIGLPLNF